MTHKPRTLRRTLLLWLLIPLLTLFGLRATYTYYTANKLADRLYDHTLLTLAKLLSEQISHDTDTGRITLSHSIAQKLLADDFDQLYFAIRDMNGTDILGEADLPMPVTGYSGDGSFFYTGSMHDQRLRIALLPLTGHSAPRFLLLAETTVKRSMLAREFLGRILMPQALIIVLATVIVWFGVGRGLIPLQRLQAAVSARSHLDLSPLDESESLEEVRPLIHAINDLLQRLSQVLDAQNRFIADAAHQLRTPLAGLKTQIELILRGHDPSNLENDMQSLRTSTDRLTRLVNQLLALARNEPMADSVIARQPLDINQLASTLTMTWVPEALKKNIDLGFESNGSPQTITGDASRLKDLIDNLIDNAIRYTQINGRITVSVTNDERVCLSVTDNGPGIPPDQRERVFERFYSVLGNGAEGSGLGLAIVREIARMHGAHTRIEDGPDGIGTRISIVF